MTTQRFNNFQGLLLPLDARRVTEPFAFEGENFVPAIDGIKSEFGASVVLAQTELQDGMEDTAGATSINLPNHETTYFCNRNGIFEIIAADFRLKPLFRLTRPATTIHKWTAAEVGDVIFFARRDVGLISFNQLTGLWQVHEDLYDDIFACCKIDGRLFLITATVAAWTSIDLTPPPEVAEEFKERDDIFKSFITSVATGAGFQALSIIGVNDRDDVITCLPYEQGVITYTRGGFLRSELVNTPLVFRHRPVYTRNESPLSDFAITQYTQQQHLWLSIRGFFVHDGRQPPQPWQPLTAEFIRGKIPITSPSLFRRARLHYAPVEGWVTVSLDEQENAPGNFDICYVYVVITDGWGVFNRPHTGWHTVQLVERQLSLCYTTVESQALYRLAAQNWIETYEEVDVHELSRILLLPANLSKYTLERRQYGDTEAYDWIEEMQAEGFVFDILLDLSTGWFALNEEAVLEYYGDSLDYNFYEFPRLSLDSRVGLGLFRLPPDMQFQQLTCMDEVIIATDTQEQERQDHVDFAQDASTQAYTDEGREGPGDTVDDWSLFPTQTEDRITDAQATDSTSTVAEVDFISSLDGSYNRQGNRLQAIRDLVAGSERAQIWRGESYGLYHSIHLECKEPEQAFYVRSIDLNLRPSGVHP